MNETRRFMRYVLPGGGAFVLFFAYTFLAESQRVLDMFKDDIPDNAAELLSLAIGAIIGAGLLGYLLSVIHHNLLPTVYAWIGVNRITCGSKSLLTRARRARQIQLVDQRTGCAMTRRQISAISDRDAWIVLNVIWYAMIGDSKDRFEVTESRSKGLWDIAHGTGVLLIGSLLALGAWWFGVDGRVPYWWTEWLVLVGAIAIPVVLFFNLARSLRYAQGFDFTAVTTWLFETRKKPHEPLVIRLTPQTTLFHFVWRFLSRKWRALRLCTWTLWTRTKAQ